MGRLLAIDMGQKRCGVAVTDPQRIVANPLETVDTARLPEFVADYCRREPVDLIVVGRPLNMNGEPSDSTRYILPAVGRLRKALPPGMEIAWADERFTSVLAHRAMIDGGMRRMARRDKAVVDKISAAIILNDFITYNQ
ncbi:MAG: Holliday junction resolvase RuvX [Alistipes timonensis]|nr:Holliday junction resolvase RuvX [Alistipes timonensis]